VSLPIQFYEFVNGNPIDVNDSTKFLNEFEEKNEEFGLNNTMCNLNSTSEFKTIFSFVSLF